MARDCLPVNLPFNGQTWRTLQFFLARSGDGGGRRLSSVARAMASFLQQRDDASRTWFTAAVYPTKQAAEAALRSIDR